MKRYIRTEDAVYPWELVKTKAWKQLPDGKTEEMVFTEKELADLFPYDILDQSDRVDDLVDGVVMWDEERKRDILFSKSELRMAAYMPFEVKKTAKGYIRTKDCLKFVAEAKEGKEDLVLFVEDYSRPAKEDLK